MADEESIGTLRDEIVADLLRRIVSGEWQPAHRLPTRRQLAVRYDASPKTINEAFSQLTQERFVEGRGKSGTFVADWPPHLSRYAIVFPTRPNDSGFGNFWQALSRQALSFRLANRTLEVMHGIDTHPANDGYRRLCEMVRKHLVAGLIFPHPPMHLIDTPILTTPGIPLVTVSSPDRLDPRLGMMATIDLGQIIDKALSFFAAKKRRRVAILHAGDSEQHRKWIAGLRQHRMTVNEEWIQVMHPSTPQWTRNLIKLMVNRQQRVCPDALVIADDNFVEHVITGLIEAGVRVPQDLEVISHCNFPWPTPSHLPVHRLGYDTHEILNAAIRLIDGVRAHRRPGNIMIEAQFEHELAKPN